jgi:hypothetical protein
MRPWEDWYHGTGHMYGSWLRGDPRGWRSRHHREHVDGDYKNPPPAGKYTDLFNYSKSLMKRDPVRIESELRRFVLDAVIERLQRLSIEIAIASLDGIHLHGLLRCPEHNPRIVLGIAKQYATAQLKAHGFAVGLSLELGKGIWAKGSHPEPIRDSSHFENAFDYIKEHEMRGGEVWVPADDFWAGINLLL